MSLRLNVAATRAYDHLKTRPGAPFRRSDARDPAALDAITGRIRQLVAEYRVNGQSGSHGGVYVFWTEIHREIEAGGFDDLLDRL